MAATRRYLLNLFLIPWIFVWGAYAVYGIVLNLFLDSASRRSVEFALLSAVDLDTTLLEIFGYSLLLAFASYTCEFFLRTLYPRLTLVTVILNLLLLILLAYLQWPVVPHLLG